MPAGCANREALIPQFEVSIPYTGIQTRIVLADSPEEALEKAKNGDLFLLGGGDCAVDDHSEDIRLNWYRAKTVPLECENSENEQKMVSVVAGLMRSDPDVIMIGEIRCLTQDSDLATPLGQTAEAYDNEREDA